MLDQHEFTDANGTVWLDRPGQPEGVHSGWLGLLVFSPLLICLGGTQKAYLLGGLATVFLLLCTLISLARTAVIQTQLQVCPKCQNTQKRGYTRCHCGYPER